MYYSEWNQIPFANAPISFGLVTITTTRQFSRVKRQVLEKKRKVLFPGFKREYPVVLPVEPFVHILHV